MEKETTFKITRAEKDDIYYLIGNDFEVSWFIEQNDNIDNKYYESYNYFLSEEEATKCAEKLKAYLIELRKEEYAKGE